MDESDCEPQRRRGSSPLIAAAVLAVCASGAATAQSGGAPPTSAGSGVWTDLLIVLVLIGVNGLFAMTEAAFLTVRRTRIEQLVEEGHRSARLVADMLGDPTRTLSTIQVGITFVGLITAGAAADSAVEPVAAWLRSITGGALSASGAELAALVGVMVCVTFLTLVLGEITPKSLAVQRAEPIVLMAAFPLRGIQLVTAPAVELVTRIADILVRPFGGKAAFHPSAMSQEELKLMVEQSEEYGVIETAEKEMIHSIFEFSDTSVRRVMTPRLDITAVSADTTVHELIESVNASGHSRLPVYDGDLDQIVGVVHIKDVISDLAETGNAIVRNRMKPPYFVPESKRVDDLLADFRRNKSQLAIVRDEYGTVTGVVTIEDLIEEIVGEIQDEYDLEEPEVTQLDPSTLVVDGRMAVTDFNDRMGVEVPIEGADTLGGFVFGLMGHQPAQGEETVWAGITFRIEATDGRRIQKVRVTKGPAQSTGDGAATGTAEGA